MEHEIPAHAKVCPTCHHDIPEGNLHCPDCTEERSRAAIAAYQLIPLKRIANGEGGLIARWVNQRRHIQLFGAERTFCQLHISEQARRERIPYATDDLNKCCADCRREVVRAMEEACQNSAS